MIRRTLFGVGPVLAVALAVGPALAQDVGRDTATGVQQLSPGVSGSNTSASQISRGRPLSSGPAQTVDRALPAAPAPGSLSRPSPEPQLTGERGRTDAGVQLTSGTPSAGAAPSAAARLAGRNTATERPTGPDRCDPRADTRETDVCERVIETRALDFPAPDPQPLSAEQRLLVAQRVLAPMTRDVGIAARRLAAGDIDESNAALAVASLTLGQPTGASDEEDEEPAADTSVTDAIVAGVLAGIGQQPR